MVPTSKEFASSLPPSFKISQQETAKALPVYTSLFKRHWYNNEQNFLLTT